MCSSVAAWKELAMAQGRREQLHRYFAAQARMNERERELTRMLHASLRHEEVLSHEHPVPDTVLAAVDRGRGCGEFGAGVDPRLAAEVLMACYIDTLRRLLAVADPPFDLRTVLAARLDLVLTGLTTR
jgi:hypothetical protein